MVDMDGFGGGGDLGGPPSSGDLRQLGHVPVSGLWWNSFFCLIGICFCVLIHLGHVDLVCLRKLFNLRFFGIIGAWFGVLLLIL